ncbi:MAG: electron transfer flavoprotein subunit beta/FixA family protein [Chloroflexi bacterium]|nr:electron transfer flavoprotein subunit beta/FixA family protein [Chloroflexota bacterium]MBI3732609.1 electron transfer flavoprotein subunit beta/FixA family protein [Chloroflexota bacterium]
MNIIVIVKHVPDLVEELEIAEDGKDLNRDFLKFVVNEFDDQALEQALLLKEKGGGTITAVALDAPEIDQTLFTCLAKGADKAVKIVGDLEGRVTSHAAAHMLADALKAMSHDLILTGVQSAEDLDGQVGPLLATYLGEPHVSVVTGVEARGQMVVVRQEYAGGVTGEFEVDLPAVLGIQAAPQPPRYAPISRVRATMKEKKLVEIQAAAADGAGLNVRQMVRPQVASHAEMIEGNTDTVVERIVGIMAERGLMNG